MTLCFSQPLYSAEIHDAIKSGDSAKLKALIDQGADVNAVTANGYTPLHWAAFKNDGDAASLLLAKGAKTDAVTKDGYTPLHLAVSENAPKVVKVIITETSAVFSERFLEKHLSVGDKVFRGDELQDAHKILTTLLKQNPGNEKINFAYGLSCYALADYGRAKMTFERLLIANNKNGRARLELARTYMASGQKELARQEFKAILAMNPPAPVARNIQKTIDKLEKGPGKWTLGGRFDVGVFNDSNVNVGPDSDVISISPIVYGSLTLEELILTTESQPADANGTFLSVALAESYDAGKAENWIFGMHCAYYQNWLEDASEHENGFYQAGAGARHIGKKTMIMLPLRAAYITSGDDALVTMYGAAPKLLYVGGAKKNMQWLTSGTIEARDYNTLNDRDGYYVSLGEGLKNYFGKDRHFVTLGINVFHDNTDSDVYKHTGLAWTVGANFNITKSLAAYGRLRYTQSNYKEKEALAPEDREDTQDMFTVGITQKITDSWSVDANYQTTQNDSTFGLYQYDRDVITIRTAFVF